MLSDATCQRIGAKSSACTVCGATRLEEIQRDPANHTGGTEITGKKDASCTADGYTGDTYCKGCGQLISKGSAIPALGHSWQEATYTAPKTCARCGATEGKSLEVPFKVGDVIAFGRYPQSASGGDSTPIEWIVLDIDDGRALLLSRYGLDEKPYNTEYVDITWEQCSLRKWLNGEFLNEAFSAHEQAKIAETRISNPNNSAFGTAGGNATADRVFLLSIGEANRYFKTDDDRTAKPTPYAAKNGAYVVTAEAIREYDWLEQEHEGNCTWWLRSPGGDRGLAAAVDDDGTVYDYGRIVNQDIFAVRPAFWLNPES